MDKPRASDLLLDGLAVRLTDGPADAAPVLTAAVTASSARISRPKRACAGSGVPVTWPWISGTTKAGRPSPPVTSSWRATALTELPLALTSRAAVHIFAGELAVAASLTEEISQIITATGSQLAPYGALQLAAWQGHEATVQRLIDAITKEVTSRVKESGPRVDWTRALVGNSRGRYVEALGAAEGRKQGVARVKRVGQSAGRAHRSGFADGETQCLGRTRSRGCRHRPAPAAPTGRLESRPDAARS